MEGEDEGKPATLMETLFGGPGWNKGRTRPPARDRLLAILPYLIPMMGCIAFTNDGFEFFPLTFQFLDFFTTPMIIFYSNGFIPFFTFFGLFLLKSWMIYLMLHLANKAGVLVVSVSGKPISEIPSRS